MNDFLNLCSALERRMYETILEPLESKSAEYHKHLEKRGILNWDIVDAGDAIEALFHEAAYLDDPTPLQRYLISCALEEIDYTQLAEIFALRCEYPFESWEATALVLEDILNSRRSSKSCAL